MITNTEAIIIVAALLISYYLGWIVRGKWDEEKRGKK